MGTKRVEKVQADQEQRGQKGLEDPEKLALLTPGFRGQRRGPNGNQLFPMREGLGRRRQPGPGSASGCLRDLEPGGSGRQRCPAQASVKCSSGRCPGALGENQE